MKSEGTLNQERERALETFNEVMDLLESGEIRTAEPTENGWQVNPWVKEGIMLGFALGETTAYNAPSDMVFTDKSTFPLRAIYEDSGVRVTPPASAVRRGAYVGQGVVLMSPAYVNVGAYIGNGTMIEALAGSCCQVGENSHISAGAVIGGVLDPIGATPVILGDDVLLGANSSVTEGTRLDDLVALAPGVHISKGTPVIDPINRLAYTSKGTHRLEETVLVGGKISVYNVVKEPIDEKDDSYGPEIPKGALVINGVTTSSTGTLKVVPTIAKYVSDKKERSFELEEALR